MCREAGLVPAGPQRGIPTPHRANHPQGGDRHHREGGGRWIRSPPGSESIHLAGIWIRHPACTEVSPCSKFIQIHPNSFRRHPASPLGLQPPLKAPPSPSLLEPGRPGERMAAPPAGPCILKQSRKIIVSSPHDIAGECGLHHKALSCCAAPSPAVPAAHLQPRRGSRAGSRPMGHPCASPPWATRPRASPRRATSSRVVTRGEKERIHFLFLFLFFFFSPQRA